jgi:hypothetical protein
VKTHSGKLEYLRKARDLEKRLSVPRALYYQYENLCNQAGQALLQLREYDIRLNTALTKVQNALQAGDAGDLSWGAAQLSELRRSLGGPEGEWTGQQIEEVEKHEAAARIETQKLFASWLCQQKVPNIAQVAGFLRYLDRIANNLDTLGLVEERAALEQHTTNIQDHIVFLDEVRSLQRDIANLTQRNKPNASTSLRDIRSWLEQGKTYKQTLTKARERKVVAAGDTLDAAETQLKRHEAACNDLVKHLRDRALAVYNAEIHSLGDIRNLQAEVITLRQLFAGQEEDLKDCEMVRAQLGDLEADYRRLDRDDLSDPEFDQLLKECITATEDRFGSYEPPLDNDAAYKGLAKTIRVRRQGYARQWIEANVPQPESVANASADQALQIKQRLQGVPKLLNAEQMNNAKAAIAACDKRLDELAVDGLVAKYQVLPQTSKDAFLRRIGVM